MDGCCVVGALKAFAARGAAHDLKLAWVIDRLQEAHESEDWMAHRHFDDAVRGFDGVWVCAGVWACGRNTK